ncbi:unnamed protein product, partial [Thlaspi arvense]
FISAAMFVLAKAAFNDGMSSFVFVFYRQAIGSILLLPFAIIFEGKKASRLSVVTLSKIFMLSLVGITVPLNANGLALVYTSPTMAAAITNTLPVITFFLALILRMEKLRLRTVGGVAKAGGIVFCLGGVVILALYRGPCFKLFLRHPLLSSSSQDHTPYSQQSWLKGCVLMFVCPICWALWIVFQFLLIQFETSSSNFKNHPSNSSIDLAYHQLKHLLSIFSLFIICIWEKDQTRVLEEYPSKLAFTSLQCIVSAIQSFLVAIAIERNPSQWKLGWKLGSAAVAYSGTIVTGVGYYIQAWLLEKKGPVFQAMWTPAGLILTIFCSMFLLGETVSLGSVVGGMLLVASLYSVLWGKSKEQKVAELKNESELSIEAPPSATFSKKTSRDADEDSTGNSC